MTTTPCEIASRKVESFSEDMTTRDSRGESVRGFVVRVQPAGRKLTLEYPPRNEPYLTLAKAAEIVRTALQCESRVEVLTRANGIAEILSGSELVKLAEYETPEMFAEETTAARYDGAREARERLLAMANRRLIAKEIDTTGDWVDARDAADPLLAWMQ